MYPTLRKEVIRLQDGIVRFTQDLIRTPSFSLGEAEVAGMVENKMRDLEFDLVFPDEIGNIVGVIHGGDPGFSVVLNSHMDTVHPNPMDQWSSPPFFGGIIDGRITGVGAADCKSGVATQIFAAHALARSMLPLRGNIVVAATVAEENGCSVGTRHLFQHTLPRLDVTPRFVVLGEPTGLKVGCGHDGWARFDIRIMGGSERDVRATTQQVSDTLSLLCDTSGTSPSQSIMAANPPKHTGANTCFTGRIGVVRRLLNGETPAGILDWLNKEIVNNIELGRGIIVEAHLHEELQRSYTGKNVRVSALAQPWLTDLSHPLVDHAREALTSAGFEWTPALWALDRLGMGTAGNFINSEIGIPTIGFGPGDENQAHACNESVSIPHLVEAAYGTAVITHGLVGASLKGMH